MGERERQIDRDRDRQTGMERVREKVVARDLKRRRSTLTRRVIKQIRKDKHANKV